jgi:hypothetical protein
MAFDSGVVQLLVWMLTAVLPIVSWTVVTERASVACCVSWVLDGCVAVHSLSAMSRLA